MFFDATGLRTTHWSTGDFRGRSEALLDTAVETTRGLGHPKPQRAAHTHNESCSWFQRFPAGQT